MRVLCIEAFECLEPEPMTVNLQIRVDGEGAKCASTDTIGVVIGGPQGHMESECCSD